MIKCPNCTGELEFDVSMQSVKCKYCGTVFNPNELNEQVKMSKEEENTFEGKSYKCSQCGATLTTFDETAITFCSYCGSQAMIESKLMKHDNPDFVIPFKKTKEECINAYKNKISKFIFLPKYMKQDVVCEKFRGIYMPYGIYEVGKNGKEVNHGSKYSHRSGDYVYYDEYSISSDIEAEYNGISYDLVSNFYDRFSNAIPYNYHEKVDFNPNYLTGYYADSHDVDSDVYNDSAKSIAEYDCARKMGKMKEFSKYGCHSPKASLDVKDKKIGLFPVYFLAIRNNDRLSYAVVNGQTGEVAVDLPVSFLKYVGISILISIIVFLLVNSFLVLTPNSVTIFSALAGIVSLIVSAVQSKKINTREKHEDDKGMMYSLKEKKTKEKKKMFKYLYKEILAIVIPILVFFSNVVSDEYYYLASIVSFVLVILSFYDLVKEHNLLVSNRLPQLEKRGGDVN